MNILETEIYCTYDKKYVKSYVCDECDRLYDCDNNWCDNHMGKNCENKTMGLCNGCDSYGG